MKNCFEDSLPTKREIIDQMWKTFLIDKLECFSPEFF